MYNIIREIIVCFFLVCSIIVIKKSKIIRKRLLYFVFLGIAATMLAVLMIFPFENLFVTFDSPEAAYEYFCLGKSNIELVVEGKNCDFVIDNKNGSKSYLIIPKTEEGWKIGVGWNTKRIAQKFSNGITVYAYQYKKTDDYFITVFDTAGGESTISDDYNTKFYSLERNDDQLGKKFVTYYAHISDLDSQYSVTVNDNQIVLDIG